MSREADLVVIGAGPGGYVAALRAAQLGAKVILVERKYVGGVCLNEGCIPIKVLLRSAEVLALAERASEFGVDVGTPKLNWATVQARKSQLVRQITQQVELLLRKAGVDILWGTARFTSPRTVQVDMQDGAERVEANRFIVAAGSHATRPPIPGLDHPDVMDHVAALSIERLPQSLLIIGGGAEGAEFANAFRAYGVKVTLIELLPHLLPVLDAELGVGLGFAFAQRGIKVYVGASVTALKPGGDGLIASLRTPNGEERVDAEKVLVCTGRRPNVDGLGLDAAGVRYGSRGVEVDKQQRTSVPHIYAIGDMTGGKMLAHSASRQAEIAVSSAIEGAQMMGDSAVPSCVFTDPEIASVGLSEEEALQHGYNVQVGKFSLSGNGKALVSGESEGFVKVVSEQEYGEVLGVHIIGSHASDLILEGTLALTLEVTLDELEAAVHPHPTLGEAVAEAVLAVRGRAIHSPKSYSR